MQLEEQIRLHKEIHQKIEELEKQKKALSESIMQGMEGKSLQMGSYLVKRFSRLCISTTLDDARIYQATQMEETVDKEKLKTLYKSGTAVPGVKEINYIQISIRPDSNE